MSSGSETCISDLFIMFMLGAHTQACTNVEEHSEVQGAYLTL